MKMGLAVAWYAGTVLPERENQEAEMSQDKENPFEFVKPTVESEILMNKIRVCGREFHSYLTENVLNSRERSLALTKLEEAVMWANKAVVAHQ